jgi:hypothetical protein
MKSRICAIFLGFLFLVSCSKNNEMTVTLKTSGSLKVKLTDAKGNAIANKRIKLYDYYSSSSSSSSSTVLDQQKTDNNGEVDFGELNASTYAVVCDTTKVNGIVYSPIKQVQIISANSKYLTINAESFSGTIRYTINKKSSTNGTSIIAPFSELKYILVSQESYISYNYFSDLIPKAQYSGTTGSDGVIEIKAATGNYELYIYLGTGTTNRQLKYIYLYQDDIQTSTYTIDPTSLYNTY